MALKITDELRRDIQQHYGLREPICNADVRSEYLMLCRKTLSRIAGDYRLEALLNVFRVNGSDPFESK